MNETDKLALKLIDEIKKQKEEISKVEKPNWKTNCSFFFPEIQKTINLHVESNVETLLEILTFLLQKEHFYKIATEKLNIVSEFKWQRFTVDEWKDDIGLRISKINIDSKKKTLSSLEARLDKIISPEIRAKLELEKIIEELS